MKKLLQILSSAVVSVAFMGSMAGATPTSCDGNIENTGPGSNNQISCTDLNNVVVTCTNNVIVGTVNTQNATSGSGNVQFNNQSGAVETGQAVNYNGTNVTVGASCGQAPAAVTSAVTPGQGDFSPPGGGAGAAGGPAELPNTSSSPAAALVAGGVAITTLLAAASRVAVVAYRHFAIK